MIRSFLWVLLAALWPLTVVYAAAPSAVGFEEGKDYVKLPTPMSTSVPDKVEVLEFFSYNCPHCNELEPASQAWLKRKPDNVTLVRVPVVFGPTWESTARAYYVAESLGVLEKIHQPLFKAIHEEKRKLGTVDEMAAFFAEHGVDQEAFRKAYTSFQTETQLRRGEQLVKRYGIRGVPAIIVHGQYEIRSPRFFEVVDFLLTR
jgi:thiol:disulfide interchange protein DsbA